MREDRCSTTLPDTGALVFSRILFMGIFLAQVACANFTLPNGSPRELARSALETAPHLSKVQIIVTYSGQLSTHAALRLENTHIGPVFWDPAGIYGVPSHGGEDTPVIENIDRVNDLVLKNVPNLLAYWDFALATGDSSMEVLEWNLSVEEADEIYRILLSGAGLNGHRMNFHTSTTAPFCSIALSDFLQRFGKSFVTLRSRHLLPHNLAAELRSQNPDRILLFRRDRRPLEYITNNGPPMAATASPRTQSRGEPGHKLNSTGSVGLTSQP